MPEKRHRRKNVHNGALCDLSSATAVRHGRVGGMVSRTRQHPAPYSPPCIRTMRGPRLLLWISKPREARRDVCGWGSFRRTISSWRPGGAGDERRVGRSRGRAKLTCGRGAPEEAGLGKGASEATGQESRLRTSSSSRVFCRIGATSGAQALCWSFANAATSRSLAASRHLLNLRMLPAHAGEPMHEPLEMFSRNSLLVDDNRSTLLDHADTVVGLLTSGMTVAREISHGASAVKARKGVQVRCTKFRAHRRFGSPDPQEAGAEAPSLAKQSTRARRCLT